jgi:surfeit locus 1 family protein
MKLGHYEFKPGLIPTLVTLILMPIFISLGFWQLDRAGQKRVVQTELTDTLQHAQVKVFKSIDDQELLFRRVEIEGRFEAEYCYLLDNAIWQGKPGYLVLMPFRYAGGRAVMLVNRGWLALGSSRDDLPAIPTPSGIVTLQGVLSEPPGKLLELDSTARLDTTARKWPQVIQQVDLEQIGQQLGYTMSPLMLQINADSPHAFMQAWRPLVDTPQKNISYAIQWFLFAAILLLLFVILNTKRPENRQKTEK